MARSADSEDATTCGGLILSTSASVSACAASKVVCSWDVLSPTLTAAADTLTTYTIIVTKKARRSAELDREVIMAGDVKV